MLLLIDATLAHWAFDIVIIVQRESVFPVNSGLNMSHSLIRNRKLLALLLVLWGWVGASPLWGADSAVVAEQARRVAVVEQAAPAVVAIFAAGGKGGGSGVLISPDGFCVTNFHVVQGNGSFMKCGLNDGKVYDSVLVGIDPTGDVALIQLLGRDDFPHAIIGDSNTVEVGDWAYAMGNPFLLATDFHPTVTYGIVSGVHRYQYPAGTFLEYTDCIQVDTSINPGNSGGPLFSDNGELIGINGRGSFEKRGRVNSGAGYAISINQVMYFLDHLKSGRVVDHATLGATVTSADDGAVYVANILEQSEAFRRGLRSGDEIVSFAGRSIRSTNQFKNILGIYPKGWTLPLVYRRDDKKTEIAVRLRALHRSAELAPGRASPPQPMPDEDKPDGDDPDKEQPKREGDKPQPQLPPGHPQPVEAPVEFAHMHVEKHGFANYYFNELNQKRLFAGLDELGDFTNLTGRWELNGISKEGLPVVLKMNEAVVASIIGADPALQNIADPPADLPVNTGGLLTAVHQLRKMLTDRHNYFSDLYYLGSEPLDGLGEQVDVLITQKGTVISRWYFSQTDGRFVGWDTALEEDRDECEIRINSFQKHEAVQFPSSITVRHAGELIVDVTFEQILLEAAN